MFLRLLAGAIGGGLPALVTLSGGAFSHTVTDPTNAESGIRLKSTGFIQEQDGASFASRDTATDWIIPHSAARVDYDCRGTNVVGDACTTSAAADDTWIDCGSDRTWSLLQSSVGTATVTFDFEIRDPEGTTVASTSYSLTAVVDGGG